MAPATLPGSLKQFGPFVRYELLEDRYDRAQNRNLIGRPEFFSLGLNASVQLGWASTGLGSSRDALLYSASLSRGFEPVADHLLTAAATLGGTEGRRGDRSWLLGLSTRYYRPLSPHWLFYALAAGDWASADSEQDPLLLGGDNGLRGYPLRFQSGTRRVLLTAEQRFYTDWYPWRLFRVGGAAFVDAGRAWGGLAANTGHDGLADRRRFRAAHRQRARGLQQRAAHRPCVPLEQQRIGEEDPAPGEEQEQFLNLRLARATPSMRCSVV